MGRNSVPIKIEKIKVIDTYSRYSQSEISETVKYLFSILEKNEQWPKTFICGRDELLDFRDRINKLIDETTTAEVLKVNADKAKLLDEHYANDSLCQNCKYKLSQNCLTCLLVLQSPLERLLFLELSKESINFFSQYALNWQGEAISIQGRSYDNPTYNFKEVLTVVDFYIEKRDKKLCIYTDGHNYHERTEEQAQKDRNIDRKLQALGFKVLRFTGKDLKENMTKVIGEIKHWINYVSENNRRY